MLFAAAFLPMFGIGGLTGIPLAFNTTDLYLHDTYYIIAHFHYIVAPGTIDDFRWMLGPALSDPDPVIIFEPKRRYWLKGISQGEFSRSVTVPSGSPFGAPKAASGMVSAETVTRLWATALASEPHVGIGGLMPTPRKLRNDSWRIACGIVSVA